MKTILYVCVHDAGRSQMTEAFTAAIARELSLGVRGLSAGTAAGTRVDPTAAEAMAELGIPMDGQATTQLDQAMADEADRVITMGCGVDATSCPARVHVSEDWGLDDAVARPMEVVRTIHNQVRARGEALLSELGKEAR